MDGETDERLHSAGTVPGPLTEIEPGLPEAAAARNLELMASLSSRIDAALRDLLPAGSRCALVGYPNHWNTGDPAVWLGALDVLERLGVQIVYECEWRTYSKKALSEAVDDGPILINGGGDLGDLWPNDQGLRERVLQDFPNNPVLQLPQSIWYEKEENVERFRRLCEHHTNFHLLVREAQSLELARSYFDVPSSLCPDMVFALGSIEPPVQATKSVFWLSRSDKESRFFETPQSDHDLECRDWLELDAQEQALYGPDHGLVSENDRLTRLMEADRDAAATLCEEIGQTYRPLARLRLDRGLRLLARGRVVISDRLHGHILSMCMGIPNVTLDNSYGKVRSTYETWTSSSPICTWADSPSDALANARSKAELLTPGRATDTLERQ